MAANSVKWCDPDEVILGIAGLSSCWSSLRKQLVYVVGGNLLDRLQPRESIDSMIPDDPSAGVIGGSSKVSKGSCKIDHSSDRPPNKGAYVLKKRTNSSSRGDSSSSEEEFVF
ncbi:hypothetical protein LXL04_029114 [Taraxacum kok-saghyz]